jgi:hypothetical protein
MKLLIMQSSAVACDLVCFSHKYLYRRFSACYEAERYEISI